MIKSQGTGLRQKSTAATVAAGKLFRHTWHFIDKSKKVRRQVTREVTLPHPPTPRKSPHNLVHAPPAPPIQPEFDDAWPANMGGTRQ
jgi:hypothetical protein